MENFNSLGLPSLLLQSLEAMNFTTPTPIQAQTIPAALAGKDVLGSAQTGTGKTAAFGIPLVASLLNSPEGVALVLTPTRELAMQVHAALGQILGTKSGITTSLLIGGEPLFKQFKTLRTKPRIIVGTPGRVNDHIARGSLSLSDAKFLVLDETDRMLDMGFSTQIDKILETVPAERQTLMFSATMAPSIIKMAGKYLKDALRVSVGSTTTPNELVTQEVIKTSDSEKYGILLERLTNNLGTFIVFVKTKIGSDKLASRLSHDGHLADAIHGDLHQRVRQRVIQSFRDQKKRILVATDVAARGLDIPHIEFVVNYDLPLSPEDYIHRIGRAGRAGVEGKAISFVTAQDGAKWRSISRLIDKGEHTEGGFERRPQQRRFEGGASRFGGGFGGKPRFDRGGDRPARSFSDKPRFEKFDREDREDRPARSFDDKPRFDRGDRPARSFDDKPRFGGFGDKPRFERSDRPARSFDDKPRFDRGDRPARSFDDKPRFGGFGDKPRFERSDRPARSFDDKPRFDRGDRPARSFDDKPRFGGFGDKPRFERSDRPARSFDDKPRFDRGDRPARSFDDKPRFGGFGDKPRFERSDRPARSFDDKPRFDRGDRPARSFGDKPRFGGFGDKPRFERSDRPARTFDDKPFKKKSERAPHFAE